MATALEEDRQLVAMEEAIGAWDKFVSPRDTREAKARWEVPAQTYEGQLALLKAARKGDLSAINFLFLALKTSVSKGFWRFVGNNPAFQRQRIGAGDQGVVAAMVYEILLGAAGRDKLAGGHDEHGIMDVVSPLSTFDPTVFGPGTDLISKFAYYFRAALMNQTRKENDDRTRQGITGSLEKSEVDHIKGSTSIDAYEDPDRDLAHGAMSAEHAQVEDLDAWEGFADDLGLDQTKAPTPREVLKHLLNLDKGFSSDALAKTIDFFGEKYGVKGPNTIRSRLTVIGQVLLDHNITQEAFLQLLTSVGGQELAKTL